MSDFILGQGSRIIGYNKTRFTHLIDFTSLTSHLLTIYYFKNAAVKSENEQRQLHGDLSFKNVVELANNRLFQQNLFLNLPM